MTTTPDQLLAACQIAFPDRTGLEIQTINPLASTHHEMTAFFLASDQGKQPLILRRYDTPIGWQTLGAQPRAEREMAVLNTLSTILEPTFPAPPAYASGGDAGGKDAAGEWLLIGALPGRNWWLPLGLVDFEKVLPGILRQQIRHMVRLHSLDTELIDGSTLPTITPLQVIESFREKLRPSKDIDVLSALDEIQALMADMDERPPRLIHGDAEITNVLVNQQGEMVAWVDWDDAALADPRWDVGALLNSLRGEYDLHALAARAAADYSKDMVRPLKRISAWTALHAVLHWAASAWLRDEASKGRTYDFPAADRMQQLYDSSRAWAVMMLEEAAEEAKGGG